MITELWIKGKKMALSVSSVFKLETYHQSRRGLECWFREAKPLPGTLTLGLGCDQQANRAANMWWASL